jgi:hypothetical protein
MLAFISVLLVAGAEEAGLDPRGCKEKSDHVEGGPSVFSFGFTLAVCIRISCRTAHDTCEHCC